MRIWAITGGIATGKSTVTKLFAELGATIASADDDARAVLADGSETRALVLATFLEARAPGGTVDRAKLAAIIYNDPDARKRLNAIMHPAIRKRMRAKIDDARASSVDGLLLYEVPLLFEGNLETWFDGVIATSARPEIQSERLRARETAAGRPPLTDQQIRERLDAQMPAAEKTRRADIVIPTDIPLGETRRQVEAAFEACRG